jgi:hypothetical protein
VRPAGSPPLEWYFQMGARWVPKDAASSAEMANKLAAAAAHTAPEVAGAAGMDVLHSEAPAAAGAVGSGPTSLSSPASLTPPTSPSGPASLSALKEACPTDQQQRHHQDPGHRCLKAMSLENIAGPGTYDLFTQREYLLTFPTPTRLVCPTSPHTTPVLIT